MDDRSVQLYVTATGRAHVFDGPKAELLALICATALSDRSVQLLRKLVLNEEDVAAISCGNLDVVLTQTRATLYRRQQLPKREIGGRRTDAA